MIAIEILGLIGCALSSLFTYRAAKHCKDDENEDIFMPFTSIIFTFYPLIIALPEAHFKLMKYTIHSEFNDEAIDEDQLFPQAFLISTITVTACIIIYKCFFDAVPQEGDSQQQQNNKLIQSNANGIKYFLPFALLLQNVVNYYYICIEEKQNQIIKELILMICYSSLLGFSFVYVLFENESKKKNIKNLVFLVTSGYLIGFLLSFIVSPFQGLLVLPCISIGFQIYVSVFLLFPKIFSLGENPNKDKSNYCTIIIAFLITIVYYPFCFILRI